MAAVMTGRIWLFLLLFWPGWVGAKPTVYVNPRYGFKIEIPSGFRPLPEAENGDGQIFEGPARITVYGSNQVASETAQSTLALLVRECPGKVAYKARGQSWYVISWSDGGSVVYVKGLIGKGCSNTLRVEYPKGLQKRLAPVVNRLEATFKPGDLSQAH